MTPETNGANKTGLRALCILEDGPQERMLLSYLKRRDTDFHCINSFTGAQEALLEGSCDLILLDSDLETGDIVSFLDYYRNHQNTIPLLAVYNGGWGSRRAALIRLGAFDAFPKDIGRWNAEVYLDRAMVQAGIVKQLIQLSRTDHVTGLHNQRYLYESLEREIRRAVRTGSPLTIALLDVDNFKQYNDAHGHLMGDRALADIGKALLESIREGTDSAYRYGGDEFMVILSGTDLNQGRKSIKRILKNIERTLPEVLTFSVGISLLHSCQDIAPFIKSADFAMYSAKKSGGNLIQSTVCDTGP